MQALLWGWWGVWRQQREQQGRCLCDKVAPLMENNPAVFTGIILSSISILKAQFKLCWLWRGVRKKKHPCNFKELCCCINYLAFARTARGVLQLIIWSNNTLEHVVSEVWKLKLFSISFLDGCQLQPSIKCNCMLCCNTKGFNQHFNFLGIQSQASAPLHLSMKL